MPTAVLAVLGPNPAALTELCWALVKSGEPVHQAHVVLESGEAAHWFNSECRERAWPWLVEALGEEVPAAPEVHLARLSDGSVPTDAFTEGVVTALQEPLFCAARYAQRAGQVVFALSGGRWRASTALTTTVFQLLARSDDRLVEVRVDDRRAEGGTGFFFPGQPPGLLRGRDGVPFVASEIGVVLEPVEVPRLRPLLAEEDLRSYAAALRASERRLRALAPPERVCCDLRTGDILIGGETVRIGGGKRVLWLWLLHGAAAGRPWVGAHDEAALLAWLDRLKAVDDTGWTTRRMGTVLEGLRDEGAAPAEDWNDGRLRQLWSKTAARVTVMLSGRAGAEHLVPRPGTGPQRGCWRVTAPPERIEILPSGSTLPNGKTRGETP